MSLRSYIKNTADPLYSRYIRVKEADRYGYCTCVTCGKRDFWRDVDAGHYVNRDDWPTRYEDRNVHAQCRACNRFHGGRISRYAVYLTERYGDDVLFELDQQSRKVKTFTLTDLKDWCKIWKAEIDKMSIVKNL